jgi:putative ABC transport system permease protein
MLKNYLLITFRNLLRSKVFSLINMVGLALGISCSFIIFLWVKDEVNTDQFHVNNDRLYRIMENQSYTNGSIFTFSSTPGPMAPVIKEKYPEIELATRITWPETRLFAAGEKSFYQEGRFVDPDFLLMHTFPLVKGEVNRALNDMYSIVVSQAMAQKYFGSEDPIGKVLVMDNDDSFTVTGVLDNIPATSSMKFEYLIPFSYYYKINENWLKQWGNNNIRTNILLTAGTDVTAFSEKLKFEIRSHTEGTNNIELIIQPLKDAYLYGKFESGKIVGGRIENVQMFSVVAVLVLIIASINFMNLTTAQSARRAKEVGLRKTIGAVRNQLAVQFMGESIIMVILASLVAVVMTFALIPFFNRIAGKELSLLLVDADMVMIFIGIILFTGIVSGSYPALYVSGFNPGSVLKGQIKSGKGASNFRKILVVGQFGLSIILIISTIVVFRQMEFVDNKDIGFNRKNVVYMWMHGDMHKHQEAIRQTLLNDPSVEMATLSSVNPIAFGNSSSNLVWEGKKPDDRILFSNFSADYEFVETMGMEIIEGRGFDRKFTSDTANFIINEAAKRAMGFDHAAEQPLTVWDERKGKIVGVVRDFNFQSVHSKVEPLFMMLDSTWFSAIFIRYKDGQLQQTIRAMEKVSHRYAAAYPFEYKIMNDDWDNLYKNESRDSSLFTYFAFLSIVISCLGLFGLSAFSAEQRTKELGVRKVLGASVPTLMQLMAKEFTVLVIIAAALGCPAGWYFMNQWLQKFAYHIDVGYLTLIIASVVCLVITLLTVSYHSAKVAMNNPVKSLRYE